MTKVTKERADAYKDILQIRQKCKLFKKSNINNGYYYKLKVGTVVKMTGDLGAGWSKVEYRGKAGYIKNTCLNRSGLSAYKTIKVVRDVQVRTAKKISPGTRMGIRLVKDTEVRLIAVEDKWCQIKYKIKGKYTDCYIVKSKTSIR